MKKYGADLFYLARFAAGGWSHCLTASKEETAATCGS